MVTLLLIVIYVGFIGLGLPDSLFGSAWPAIYDEFGLHLSFGSLITVITTMCTVLSSMQSARMIKWIGTGKVALISTVLTSLGILGISVTGSFWFICLCAVPLGLGGGAIDTALNNYVSQHYAASQMSFLHCFYGIGISLSPFLMTTAMSDNGWRGGYRFAFWIQLGIAAVLFLALPLWKKVGGGNSRVRSDDSKMQVLSVKQIFGINGVKTLALMYFTSVAIECTCGAWGSTYLVERLGQSAADAAGWIMFYFVGIAVGRFLSGLLAIRISCRDIIRISSVLLGAALLLLLTVPTVTGTVIALFLTGTGNGPMYPNLTYLIAGRYGSARSASIIGLMLAVTNVSCLLMPVVCSLLGGRFGMWVFPPYLLIFFLIFVAASRSYRI